MNDLRIAVSSFGKKNSKFFTAWSASSQWNASLDAKCSTEWKQQALKMRRNLDEMCTF